MFGKEGRAEAAFLGGPGELIETNRIVGEEVGDAKKLPLIRFNGWWMQFRGASLKSSLYRCAEPTGRFLRRAVD
jgi:hypothetical protein